MNKYFLETEHNFAQELKQSLEFLAQLTSGQLDVLLVVPTKQNISQGYIRDLLGSSTVKKLLNNETVSTPKFKLTLATQRSGPTSWSGVIWAVYISGKHLDRVTSMRNPTDLLVVPWTMNDSINEWVDMHQPTIINRPNTPATPLSQPTQSEPSVLENAIKALSIVVNLSSGLAHPSDKAQAVATFKLLKKHGEPFDPDDVKRLAVQNDWQSAHAKELATIAQKIAQGKTVRTQGGGGWREDIIDTWRNN